MTRTGGELLADQLVAEGVRTVFGVPGVQLDYAVDGLAQHRDEIDFVVARHEQGAGYMADGYARVAGRPGVMLVVPGPGVLNAGAALATAYAASSPVVCIAGQIPSPTIGRGYGMLHEVTGQSELLRSVTKWHRLVTEPNDVAAAVREAFDRVSSGRPQPVAIELPPDVLKAATSAATLDRTAASHPEPGAAEIEAAAALLAEAKYPVIYVGGGVRDRSASAALIALAEKLGAPVVMSRNGLGAIDSRHPLALTRLSGGKALEDADAVIAIGTRFMTQQAVPVVAPGRHRLIAINADPADTTAPRRFDVTIVADAERAMTALAHALASSRPAADVRGLREGADAKIAAQIPEQSAWLAAIREAIGDDGVLVDELTQVGYPSRVAYPVHEPGTYITPGYQGTLGYGFPTALGVKVGRPDSTVVSINGDGGFGWALQELSTARKYRIGLIAVVFVNGSFGNVERIQQETFGRTIGVQLENPDYALLAQAFGVESMTADTPAALGEAIRAWAGQTTPLLVRVPVGELPSPWGLIAEHSYGGEH